MPIWLLSFFATSDRKREQGDAEEEKPNETRITS